MLKKDLKATQRDFKLYINECFNFVCTMGRSFSAPPADTAESWDLEKNAKRTYISCTFVTIQMNLGGFGVSVKFDISCLGKELINFCHCNIFRQALNENLNCLKIKK